MRKITVLFLSILSFHTFAHQNGESFAFTWSPVPSDTNLIFMPIVDYGWSGAIHSSIDQAAQRAADTTIGQPDGKKAIRLFGWVTDFFGEKRPDFRSDYINGRKSPWVPNSSLLIASELDEFFTAFSDTYAGEIDYFIMDSERPFKFEKDKAVAQVQAGDIENDPRWDEQGVNNLHDRYDPNLEGFSLYDSVTFPWNQEPVKRWLALRNELLAEDLNEFVFSVARSYFPNVQTSNFLHPGIPATEINMFLDVNGNDEYLEWGFAAPQIVGTHASRDLYNLFHRMGMKRLDGVHVFGSHPYRGLLYDQQRLRSMNRYNKTMPWIALKSYTGEENKGFKAVSAYTDYYEENVIHTAMMTGGDPILLWNPDSRKLPELDEYLVDRLLKEVNTRVGTGERDLVHSSSTAFDWGDSFITTTVKTDDHYITRLSAHSFVNRLTASVGEGNKDMRDRVGQWYVSDTTALADFNAVADNLVGHWRMEAASWNGSDGEVKDSSMGLGINLKASGDTATATTTGGIDEGLFAGVTGRAGSFDANSSTYIEGKNTAFGSKGDEQKTVIAWVKSSTTIPGNLPVIANGYNGDSYHIDVLPGGGAVFSVGAVKATYTGSNLLDGQWHMVAGVLDRIGNNSVLRIYVDGLLKQTTTVAAFSIADARNGLFIGRRYNTEYQYFDGLIDDVSVWDRALAGVEISKLFENVGYYSKNGQFSFDRIQRVEFNPLLSSQDSALATAQEFGNASGSIAWQLSDPGAYVQINGIKGHAGGDVTLRIIYASTGDGSLDVSVNGAAAQTMTLNFTGGTNTFQEATLLVTLLPGENNSIRFDTTGAAGTPVINVDYIVY